MGGNPLYWVDPIGLSEADVKKIRDIFNSTILNMTKDNDRNENPYLNNLSSSANSASGGLIGHSYLGCGDQEYVVTEFGFLFWQLLAELFGTKVPTKCLGLLFWLEQQLVHPLGSLFP